MKTEFAVAISASAFAAVMASSVAANAVCTPAAGDNVTATCTGTTNNQNSPSGYGQTTQNNLNTTVVRDATVTGTNNGINFYTGSVTNAGAVTGTLFSGVFAKAPSGTITVNNSGIITGGDYGINTFTDVTVTNSGSITGGGVGVDVFAGAATVTNTITGTIVGGITAATDATVTNSGNVSGGISADNVTVTNTITGTVSGGINANINAIVTNSGNVSGGIYVDDATVTNTITGTVSGGINVNTDAIVINSGNISGGISADNATVTNTITGTVSGGITAITDAIVSNSGNVSGGITADNVTVTNTITGTVSGGINVNTDAIVTNSGYVSGGISADNVTVTNTVTGAISGGIHAGTSAAVTNSGMITAIGTGGSAVFATTSATVTNSGTITGGSYGVRAGSGAATVTNSALITGDVAGINAGSSATVINSGTITGGSHGIHAGNGAATVTNSGTISGTGAAGIGILAGTTGNVTNSGAIIGAGGTAIQFNGNGTPGSDTLTMLPGARFGGLVNFGGGADKVNFGPGSWILNTANFDKVLSTVTTPGTPYLVTPNQIAVVDVSGFGAQNRAIMDITGWIGSVLPDSPVFASAAGSGSNSLAAADTAASPFDAFASFPPDALGYATTKAPVFKDGAATYADGNAVWARGFGGQRQQDTSGLFAGSTTTGYGGAFGYERVLDSDLKIGALVGASTNKTNLYQNAGSNSIDTVFGGAYGRFTRGGTFLDLAVIGGNLDNSNARTIAGGLALQTATASYGGWFVDPAMTLGQRIEIDQRGFAITPAVKVRYVEAHFDGYTETGSTANLAVGGRDFQAWEERAEITFANTGMIGANRVTARVTGGLLGQQRMTGGEVNIALLGQDVLAATLDRGSVAGGYGSAGLDWQIGRVTLFAAGEATYTNDATKTYAGKGGARIAW